MQILSSPDSTQTQCWQWCCEHQTLGFVPTMGALHAGHLELCRQARAQNDKFVASLFVNPTQFGPSEDLARYPRALERDCELLREAGCDLLFAPSPEAMFGAANLLHGSWIDVTPLDAMWEGVTRPGHLRGVATVVAKLFNIMRPTRAYFGEKDFQQLRVVQALVRDLNFQVEIVPVPTLREPDGLALSSRNAFLSPDERAQAPMLHAALQAGVLAARNGEKSVAALGQIIEKKLKDTVLQTQYIAIVDAQTLAPLESLDGRDARILAAVFLGKTRLIDNVAL